MARACAGAGARLPLLREAHGLFWLGRARIYLGQGSGRATRRPTEAMEQLFGNSSSGRCFMRNRGQTGALGSIVDMLPCPVDLMNHQSHPPATTTRVQTMYGGRWSVYIDVYIIYRYNTRYIGIRYTYIRLYKHEDGHVHVPCPSSGQVVYWYMDGHKMRSRVLDDTTGPGFSCSWADLNNAPRHDRYLMTPFCCVST